MELNELLSSLNIHSFMIIFSGIASNAFSVRVGSSKHASGGTIMKIKNYINHPKYNGARLDYDFSLLEFEKALEFNDKVQSITLPNENSKISDGTMCEISGWGKKKYKINNFIV